MIITGVVGIVIAAGCGVGAWLARRRMRAMVTTETLPAHEVRQLHQAASESAGAGHFRMPCEVASVAREHIRGALHSELKKVPCVWHRHVITRRYTERNSDGRTRTRNEKVSEYRSSTAFFVEDPSGKMVIRPGNHKVNSAEEVLDTFQRGGGGRRTVGFRRREWVIRAGTRLYVHGEASDENGKLALGEPADGGVFIISTKSQHELLRIERLKLGGFATGAAVTAVGGLVCLVLGLVGLAG